MKKELKLKVVIFDLDNCLADDQHREKLIDRTKSDPVDVFQEYHAACADDPLGNGAFFEAWKVEADLVAFFTSRPEWCRVATQQWIDRNLAQTNQTLLMRGDEDRRRSAEVKADQLKELLVRFPAIDFPAGIIAAFDDREDILEVYRAAGIANVQRLYIHNGEFEVVAAGNCSGSATPPVLLREAAALFEERNGQYGDSYKRYGNLLVALFPANGVPATKTPEDAIRLNMVMMCLAKLQRYAHNFSAGGHRDSAKDLQVYAAMLEEHTK